MADESKPKRGSVCKKVYFDAEGNPSRSCHANVVRGEFQFQDEAKTVREIKLEDFTDGIQFCATWHGIWQKLGDDYAGAKGNVPDAIKDFDTGYEILTGGEWITRTEGLGPRPTLIVEAVVAALIAEGQTVDDTRRTAIREKLKTKEQREAALANPTIKAEYESAKAKKAAERAKLAAKAAKDTPTDLGEFA